MHHRRRRRSSSSLSLSYPISKSSLPGGYRSGASLSAVALYNCIDMRFLAPSIASIPSQNAIVTNTYISFLLFPPQHPFTCLIKPLLYPISTTFFLFFFGFISSILYIYIHFTYQPTVPSMHIHRFAERTLG
ncbi:hypothetical protein V8E52_002676 [Russula decolorans]